MAREFLRQPSGMLDAINMIVRAAAWSFIRIGYGVVALFDFIATRPQGGPK